MPQHAVLGPRLGGDSRRHGERFAGISTEAMRSGQVLKSHFTNKEYAMYEKPKLVQVGEVEEVVLGAFPTGGDLDGNQIITEQEFEDDDIT